MNFISSFSYADNSLAFLPKVNEDLLVMYAAERILILHSPWLLKGLRTNPVKHKGSALKPNVSVFMQKLYFTGTSFINKKVLRVCFQPVAADRPHPVGTGILMST